MKNQLDLILGGTFLAISIGVAVAFFFNKRVPVRPPEPSKPVVTQVKYPDTPVPMGIGLGFGGQQQGQGGGAPAFGGGGGAPRRGKGGG